MLEAYVNLSVVNLVDMTFCAVAEISLAVASFEASNSSLLGKYWLVVRV